MKRFLIIATGLSVIVFIFLYLYFVEGVYISFLSGEQVNAPFYTEDEQFYMETSSGKEIFEIKGVELDSGYGPSRGSDFMIKEEDWKRWFGMIQRMGANTIRISTVLDQTFYKALYEYNENNNTPLFLLQGIRVPYDDAIGDSHKQMRFYEVLKEDAKDVIDIIHGRNIILTNGQKGSGWYRYDLSPYVVGFLIGDEWNQDMVSYLDHTLNDDQATFNGEYIETVPDATTFEKLMAQLIDEMIQYETNKYQTQRPISVNSTFVMDPFEYPEHIKQQLGKINRFTMDHFISTDAHQAGLFASYSYEEWPEEALSFLKPSNHQVAFGEYLSELNDAHHMPMIISSFGYPSDTYLNQVYNQGEQLINDLNMFKESQLNGAIIRSFQDVWDRRNITTAFMYDLQKIYEWSDALTPNQHFGLIGFKSYRQDVLMKIDGEKTDWADIENVSEKDDQVIKVTRDHAYLYMLIESDAITRDTPLYFGFDVHPTLGVNDLTNMNVTLSEPIEFMLKIFPNSGGEMHVIDRYQASRQQFLERVNGTNPYIDLPEDPPAFERFKVAERNKELTEVNATTYSYPYIFTEVDPLVINSTSEESDIYLTDQMIELRIPYGLLNMYDPLKPTIHDDYYENYGVEPLSIDGFHLSMFNENNVETDSLWVSLDTLSGNVKVKEVIKPSYEAVKRYWGGEDEW